MHKDENYRANNSGNAMALAMIGTLKITKAILRFMRI